MKIEVAVAPGSTTKQKGDLLENVTCKLLAAQQYSITQELRLTAVELDLLCTHKVSGKQIYVECKAQRANIDAGILKHLAGTLFLKDYEEAWIISTAEFGKEAKGFAHEWKQKPKDKANQLSFYTPELVIDSLINSGSIKKPPQDIAIDLVGSANLLGEWTLSITTYGNFWLTTKLSGGIPIEVFAFYAINNEAVVDNSLLSNLAATDTSLRELKFIPAKKASFIKNEAEQIVDVVQIQSGDSWSDYRPSRPQDFVGRTKDLNSTFDFFKAIVNRETKTRVFAFTGDSGMGKSSLIAKIADKSNTGHNKKKYFVFPIDVRAATSPSYVYSALLRCLKSAQTADFGSKDIEINITDANNPLNSVSVRSYLSSVEKKSQLIVLILDQFEELYSKQELDEVFDRAKSLLLSTAAYNGNLCLGFAWKTDSTTHNENPAYFFWHQLADYRITRKLTPFSDQDSASAINIFEKEIGQKLQNDLRHNLMVSSQGYPWLLKKICIHLYENIEQGVKQEDLLENQLDITKLFDGDLKQLSQTESSCLDFVAQRAPVDSFEVLDRFTPETLDSLVNRRLVIRSGPRLNIYWDIFREYLLTKKVPTIPLRYLPYTDFNSVLSFFETLNKKTPMSVSDIAKKTGFSEGTVANIGTDINTFDIANRSNGCYILSQGLDPSDPLSFLRRMRDKFKKHAFTLALQRKPSNLPTSIADAINILKDIFPNNMFAENTWKTYTLRLCRWLEICGLLIYSSEGWTYRDKGDVVTSSGSIRSRKPKTIFPAPTSPNITIEVLEWLVSKKVVHKDTVLPKGYRSGLAILNRFQLAIKNKGEYKPDLERIYQSPSLEIAIWGAAFEEVALRDTLDLLEENAEISGTDIAKYFDDKFNMGWKDASLVRIGRAIKQWAIWLKG